MCEGKEQDTRNILILVKGTVSLNVSDVSVSQIERLDCVMHTFDCTHLQSVMKSLTY